MSYEGDFGFRNRHLKLSDILNVALRFAHR
jgi:hypothetical protein